MYRKLRSNFADIMGTPVSSGKRGIMALGASLTNLCAEGSEELGPFLMLGHDDNRPVPFRTSGKNRMIQVVNCRLSPKSRPCDHLVWKVFATLLYHPIF